MHRFGPLFWALHGVNQRPNPAGLFPDLQLWQLPEQTGLLFCCFAFACVLRYMGCQCLHQRELFTPPAYRRWQQDGTMLVILLAQAVSARSLLLRTDRPAGQPCTVLAQQPSHTHVLFVFPIRACLLRMQTGRAAVRAAEFLLCSQSSLIYVCACPNKWGACP